MTGLTLSSLVGVEVMVLLAIAAAPTLGCCPSFGVADVNLYVEYFGVLMTVCGVSVCVGGECVCVCVCVCVYV